MKKLVALTLALCLLLSTAALAEEAVVRGGTLKAAKTNNWSTLIPTNSTSRGDDRYLSTQIFDTLVSMDKDGNFVPRLAESWDMTDEALTMKLREDVKFHDGTDFNAAAVKYVFDWYVAEGTTCIFTSEIADIASVDVVDDYTVRFNLKQPSAILMSALTNNAGMIMSPAAIEKYGEDLSRNPVGTGPFMLKEAIEGDHITLARNPDYYLKGADGEALPYLDEVVVNVITEDTVKVTNMQSGDIDLTDYINTTTALDVLKGNPSLEVIRTSAGDHFCIYPNHLNPALGDVRVRQAISYALDRDALCQVLTQGYGTVAPFPVSESQWFYSDYSPYNYDPEKAKALLAEAGYADGLSLKLQNIAREPDNTIVQAVQAQLKEVGVNVEIESLERNAWVALFTVGSTEGDMGFGRWTFPRVDAYMQINNNLGATVTGNYSNYHNDEFTALMDQTKSTFDVAQRKELFAQIQKVVLDDAANIWLYQMPRHISRNLKVQGLDTDQEGIWILREVWVK